MNVLKESAIVFFTIGALFVTIIIAPISARDKQMTQNIEN